jgi:hypothetical protein
MSNIGDISSNGHPYDNDPNLTALRCHAAFIVGALEGYSRSEDPASISEIKDACSRIIAGLPFTPHVQPNWYKVETIDLSDWLITCQNCDNGFIVHGPTWVAGATREQEIRATRTCPYCEEESLVIDKRPLWQKRKSRGLGENEFRH